MHKDARGTDADRAQECPQLILEYQGQTLRLIGEADEGRCSLGESTACDLVCESRYASRDHAHLQFKNNDFYLVDHSTNGTFVQSEDEQVTRVHRNEMRLWGSGWLSLGEPLHAVDPIRFRQA